MTSNDIQRHRIAPHDIISHQFVAWAVIWAYFLATGGLTGILLGALVLDLMFPGHPLYVVVHIAG